MKADHIPEPAFINSLERQLASELRRRQMFGPPDRSAGLKRFVRMTVLIVFCTVAGVAAAKTVEHFESSRRRALNMVRAATAVELANARLEMILDMLHQIEQQVEAGILHADKLLDQVLQVKIAELELERTEMDLEEVRSTGEAPVDELYAPVLGDRDFVNERLRIEYKRAAAIEEYLEVRLARAEDQVEKDMISREETHRLRLQLGHASEECAGIQSRIDLRAAFLRGDLTARQLNLKQMLHEAKARLEISERVYDEISAQLEEVKKANADGLVPEYEVKQIEYQMISARAEYRIARLELTLVEEKLGE